MLGKHMRTPLGGDCFGKATLVIKLKSLFPRTSLVEFLFVELNLVNFFIANLHALGGPPWFYKGGGATRATTYWH